MSLGEYTNLNNLTKMIMKIDMIQVLADRKELQKIQQRMNTNFSISGIEVKTCPDCGAEHIGEDERCDICLMEVEKLAYENGCADITYSGNVMFIDGDFKTGMGNCKYHCSPTCHPGQIDHDKWHYGCTHKAWPQNKYGDFVPFVDCDGDISKCELKGKKFAHSYKRGKSLSLRYAKEKVARLEKEIAEYNERCS
jgi:hypothetical protein